MRTIAIFTLILASACGGNDDTDKGGNAVECQPSASQTTLVYCNESWTQCADGKQYQVECQGSAGAWVCSCRIDGAETKSQPGTDFCDAPPADRAARSNALCDWSIRQ